MSNRAEDKFYFSGKAKFESPKNKILAELKDLLAMLKQVKADRDDIAIVADSIKFVEKSKSSSEIGQVYRNAMDIERQYFARPGGKAKMARNSEYDTDGVKNLIHKETRDAEWGIDLYKGARGGNQYHAYHAFIGESVTTRVFGSRSEAEAWLNKKNAAGHPNKRKNSLSGGKAKFSMFGIGDKVRATSSVQGMKSGTVYKVTDIDKRHTPFGTFVTYTLDGKLSIANGHLVLEKASNSLSGDKARMANDAAWTASDDRDADRVIKDMKELERKCSKKRSEIFDVETKIIPRVIAMATAAKAEKNQKYLLTAMNTGSQADNVRYSFARSGGKAKFENPMDIEMLWKRQSNGDWAAVLWDVKAKRMVRTVRTFKSEREAKDFVNAWWQKNRPIG